MPFDEEELEEGLAKFQQKQIDDAFELAEKIISENFDIRYPGKIKHPNGYTLISRTPSNSNESIYIKVTDLLNTHQIEVRSRKISFIFERNDSIGEIFIKVLFKKSGTVYVFRQDFLGLNLSNFIIELGYHENDF